MKFTPIFALLAASAPIIAQAQTADVPAVAASGAPISPAPASAATADGFVWRFAPPVGSRWTMRSFKRIISIGPFAPDGTPNIALPAEFADSAQSYKAIDIQRVVADYDVLSRDRFGATTIRLTYRKLLNYQTYDAVGTEISRSAPTGAKRIDGATITFKQGPNGRIWNVLDTRGFVRRYLQSHGVTDEKSLRRILNSNHVPSNEDVAQYVNQGLGTLPDFPTRVGESWQDAVVFPTMTDIEVSGTRTLKVLDEKFALVGSGARFDGSDPQQKFPPATAAEFDYSQLSGTMNGAERVQRSSGLALETNVNTTLQGTSIARQGAKTTRTPVNVTSMLRLVLEPR